jgi:membrane-bound ClpP family serine protease
VSRLPPGLLPIVVAAAGALALGVGAVATLDSNFWGIPLVLGGALLLSWSIRVTRKG